VVQDPAQRDRVAGDAFLLRRGMDFVRDAGEVFLEELVAIELADRHLESCRWQLRGWGWESKGGDVRRGGDWALTELSQRLPGVAESLVILLEKKPPAHGGEVSRFITVTSGRLYLCPP
jgi:hypothetical protein